MGVLVKGKQLRDKTIEQNKLNLVTPTSPNDAATKEYVDNNAGSMERYSDRNLDMEALPNASTSGLQLATADPLLDEPTYGSGVNVFINGVQSNQITFFTSPTGDIRSFGTERLGDYCYFDSHAANYDLTSDDILDFVYIVTNGSSGTSGGTSGGSSVIPGQSDGVVESATLQGTILHLERSLELSDVTVDLSSISSNPGTSGIVIRDTYANIKALKDSNNLIPARYYVVEDFKTIHQIPNTTDINIGFDEDLAIFSIFTDTFQTRAYSTLFPNDIIFYNFDDDLAEDGITPRHGKITYRQDADKDLSAFYDWRNVKFRRWQITGVKYEPSIHSAGTIDYLVPSANYIVSDYKEYFVNIGTDTHLANPTINLDSGSSVSETREVVKPDGTSFIENELNSYITNSKALVYYSPYYDKYVIIDAAPLAGYDVTGANYVIGKYSWRSSQFTLGNNYTLLVDNGDFDDVYTFGNTSNGGDLSNIRIEETLTDALNNIIFTNNTANIRQITFGSNCSNMTLVGDTWLSFKIGNEAQNNIFNCDVAWSTIGDSYQNNLVLGIIMRYIKTEAETFNNTFISFGNIFHNHYTGLIQNNTFRFGGASGSGFLYFDGSYQNNYIYWPDANRNHIVGDMWNHSWELTSGWSNVTYMSNYQAYTHFDDVKTDKVIGAKVHEYLIDPQTDPNFGNRSIVDKGYVDQKVGTGLQRETDIPNSTSGNMSDTGLVISNTPSGFVMVHVDGVLTNLGDGVLTTDCYFSDDNGTSAKTISLIEATDKLYWNGTNAGTELTASNRIDLIYM